MSLLRPHAHLVSWTILCFSRSARGPRTSTTPILRSSTTTATTAMAISLEAARDRVIVFGKYKGRMLGSLPSNYLRWVSENLRVRDWEEWAKLADQVLQDPVYRDRIEWEFAQKVLDGAHISAAAASSDRNAVSELQDISKMFGWDNEDKVGWSMIDFGLLGTSKGGRIPRRRVSESDSDSDVTTAAGAVLKREKTNKVLLHGEAGERRRQRMERLKRRSSNSNSNSSRLLQQRSTKKIINSRSGSGEGGGERYNTFDFEDDDGDGVQIERMRKEETKAHRAEEIPRSPFPGREALLKKVLRLGGGRL